MDFNGDGRQDLIMEATNLHPASSTFYVLEGEGTSLTLGFTVPATAVWPANWNDDACTDLVSTNGVPFVAVSACNGNTPGDVQLGTSSILAGMAFDYNGDGRTDFAVNISGTWEVYVSSGSTQDVSLTPTGVSVGSGTWLTFDQNGDGLDDWATVSATTGEVTYGLHNGANTPPDLATSFADGFENTVSTSFISVPAALNTNYFPESGASPGYESYIGPLYVVQEATFSDPSSATGTPYHQLNYYAGAETNIQGRGFAGFASHQISDSRNDIYETWNYALTFPNTGM
jgi:hypothetical protein